MQISVNVHLDTDSVIDVIAPHRDEKHRLDMPLTVKLRADDYGDPVTLFLRGRAAEKLAEALSSLTPAEVAQDRADAKDMDR